MINFFRILILNCVMPFDKRPYVDQLIEGDFYQNYKEKAIFDKFKLLLETNEVRVQKRRKIVKNFLLHLKSVSKFFWNFSGNFSSTFDNLPATFCLFYLRLISFLIIHYVKFRFSMNLNSFPKTIIKKLI